MSRWVIETAEQRFWAKVNKHGPRFGRKGRCWLWTGYLDRDGYGRFNHGKRGNAVRAARWIWEQMRGPIPEGLQLDHLCRNRACVRPSHCEPVTSAENTRRGEKANRTNCLRGGHPLGANRRCQPCNTERQRERRKVAA